MGIAGCWVTSHGISIGFRSKLVNSGVPDGLVMSEGKREYSGMKDLLMNTSLRFEFENEVSLVIFFKGYLTLIDLKQIKFFPFFYLVICKGKSIRLLIYYGTFPGFFSGQKLVARV